MYKIKLIEIWLVSYAMEFHDHRVQRKNKEGKGINLKQNSIQTSTSVQFQLE